MRGMSEPPATKVDAEVISSLSVSESLCTICGHDSRIILEGLVDTRFGIPGVFSVAECTKCGTEQLLPRPSFRDLKALYERSYNFGGETGTQYTRWRERFIFSWLYKVWVRLDGDISFHLRAGSGRLLDIGCNEGRGLTLYSQNGFQVEGLELNEKAAESARSRGFIVHTCLIEALAPESYDIAVLSNVLEHSLDPRQMLMGILRVLSPKGQIWISCPNSRSWMRSLFGRSWINWHVPFHISFFSQDTLNNLLADIGFSDIKVQQISPALWVSQSIIATLFGKRRKENRQLRNPFLTIFLLLFTRTLFFPALWLGNVLGYGDCLLVVARKG